MPVCIWPDTCLLGCALADVAVSTFFLNVNKYFFCKICLFVILKPLSVLVLFKELKEITTKDIKFY